MPNQPYNMKVSIKELSFKAIIGILPIERKETQRVIIDINFEYVFHKTNDEFIDYSCVAKTVKKIMKKKQFKLIEDAIIFLEKKLYKKYNISKLHIQITKPDILPNCTVSVENAFLD